MATKAVNSPSMVIRAILISSKAIQAPLVAPAIHPRDRSLLRPLKSLGKPKNEVNDISFLRRTQYVAGSDGHRIDGSGSRNPSASIKRRKTDAAKEDPFTIFRSVIKGFDIANPQSAHRGTDNMTQVRGLPPTKAEVEAWRNPKHPTKPHLKMLDSYPILPGLDAMTDDVGYYLVKFSGNPTDLTNRPDVRMEAGLLRPMDPSPEVVAEYNAKLKAHQVDPKKHPEEPLPDLSFEFFLPEDDRTAGNLKRKFDVDDLDKDEPGLYTNSSKQDENNDNFRLNHLRVYDMGLQVSHKTNPYQEVALALHDPESASGTNGETTERARLQKAAYYYPLVAKQQLKPRRNVQLQHGPVRHEEEVEKIDVLEVTIEGPNVEETRRREGYAAMLEKKPEEDRS